MSKDYMLTTADNPYNPFTQPDEWDALDRLYGYNTLSYLARIYTGSNELSDADQDRLWQDAITEIISMNLTGNYLRVTKDGFEDEMKKYKEQLSSA